MILDDICEGNLAQRAEYLREMDIPEDDTDLEFAPELAEGAVIRSAEQANDAVRRLRLERALHDQYVDPISRRIVALNERIWQLRLAIGKADEKLASKTMFYEDALRRWFEDGATKKELKASWSAPLPDGTLSLTKPSQVLTHEDPELLAWLEANRPEFVKVTKSVAWADVKKALDIREGIAVFRDSGEVPDGVSVSEKPSEFKVKF